MLPSDDLSSNKINRLNRSGRGKERESKKKSVEGCEAIKSSFFFFAFDNDNICKFVKAKIVFLLSGHMLSLLLLILCGFSAHTHTHTV